MLPRPSLFGTLLPSCSHWSLGSSVVSSSVLFRAWLLLRDCFLVFYGLSSHYQPLRPSFLYRRFLWFLTLPHALDVTKSSRSGPAAGDEPTVVLAERVTKVRRSDGVYYSTPPAAALVAALALSPEMDHGGRRLRIVDPACGAGALLAACGQVLQRRRFSASGMQNTYAIAGFDIDPDAVGAASAAVSSAAPQAATEWRTFQHGPQAQGAAAGALELLAGNTFPLLPRGRGGYDIVVMNPPFTRNEVRGEKFETSTRDAMRQRERALRDHLRTHDPAAAAAVNPNSIQTFFVVLADFLASRADARVVIIVPTTAATSAGVRAQRVFLAERFVVECVITSHDQDLCAFSAGSGVFESVIVCRRRGMRELPADTSFVALRRAPRTVSEAEELAARLQKRQYGSYESVTAWPAWRVAAGDWTPCQWYDGRLAATAAMLEAHPALLPLGRCASLGPKEGNVRHSWLRVEAPAAGRDPRARRVVGGVGGPSQTALQGAAQQWMVPGNARAHLWDRFDARSSCLLVAERYDVLRGVLTAMWVREPTFGLGWRPVLVSDDRGVALLLWWNTTAARLLLLSRRGKLLTYPKWSTAHLLGMPVPHPASTARHNRFTSVFERLQLQSLRPLRERVVDLVAIELDRVFVELLGLTEKENAVWREWLAAEPTLWPRSAHP